ncbi:MBL fold metallo-hydrolase [Nonomuraea sp. NPDC048826]|uniref:MBL fold metallo-hydrolase n=1 Tax=Nonomuraea sp. NPDC048826 TaxID=3364347 RepID=UPI003717A272
MTHATTRPAGIRTIELGDLKVSYVPDGVVLLPGLSWLPATTEAFWADRPGHLDEGGNLVASIGGLLVEHGERALLIDAGVGPVSYPAEPGNAHGAIRGGDLLDNLAKLGRGPEEIEAVALTHLHLDHTGWLLHDPRPFRGAEVLLTAPEWAAGADPELAAQVRMIADGQEIFPGVRVDMAPGHTPGHTTYVLSSSGRRLIAFGDALHSPVQIAHPELAAAPDHDPAEAAASRRRLIGELSAPDVLGFGIHFADVQFGRVDQGNWSPV